VAGADDTPISSAIDFQLSVATASSLLILYPFL